jgi:hypothetical protein
MAKSVLVGGSDVSSVLNRDDGWYCIFYEYVPWRVGTGVLG